MRLQSRAVIAFVATFALGSPAQAAISPGQDSTPPGELFFSVWDATNQVTYTRDLGVSIIDFLNNPNQTITKAPDALYTSTFGGVDSSTLVYSVGAFNSRFSDFPGYYGYVISSNSAPANVFVPDASSLLTEIANGASYAIGANAADGGDPSDYAANRSGISLPGQSGYWTEPTYWNGDLGHTTPFTTEAAVGTSIAFYSLLLDEGGGDVVNVVRFDNVWTLAANGTLTYGPGGGGEVPLPATAWMLFSALVSALGLGRKRLV